jgi:DNA-binding transcriptional LysR family regulator
VLFPSDLINRLEAFAKTHRAGSYAAAARELQVRDRDGRLRHPTPGGVAKRVRELEKEAGIPLFKRTTHGVEATPPANHLYAYTRDFLAHAQAMTTRLQGLPESGEPPPIRTAVSHTVAEFVLPNALVEYVHKNKHGGDKRRPLALDLVVSNSVVVREEVDNERVDFGIGVQDEVATGRAGLRQFPFCEDEVLVVAPKGHPWWRIAEQAKNAGKIPEVSLEQFVSARMVMRDPSSNTRQLVKRRLDRRGHSLQEPIAEVGSTIAAKEMAVRHKAPALLSKLAIGTDDLELATLRVAGYSFTRSFVVVARDPNALTDDCKGLIEHLTAVAQDVADRAARRFPPRHPHDVNGEGVDE